MHLTVQEFVRQLKSYPNNSPFQIRLGGGRTAYSLGWLVTERQDHSKSMTFTVNPEYDSEDSRTQYVIQELELIMQDMNSATKKNTLIWVYDRGHYYHVVRTHIRSGIVTARTLKEFPDDAKKQNRETAYDHRGRIRRYQPLPAELTGTYTAGHTSSNLLDGLYDDDPRSAVLSSSYRCLF